MSRERRIRGLRDPPLPQLRETPTLLEPPAVPPDPPVPFDVPPDVPPADHPIVPPTQQREPAAPPAPQQREPPAPQQRELPAPQQRELRRSTRKIIRPDNWTYHTAKTPKQKIRTGVLNEQYLSALDWRLTIDLLKSADMRAMLALVDDHTDIDTRTIEWMHPMMLGAKANSEDNPNWAQAMNGPDQAGYWDACEEEISTLTTGKDAWDVVNKEPWMNVLPSTWAFKCKRYPDGIIRKLKARFCCRGDKQIEGVDFFDTYAPVVNWQTVRLMLILSVILGLSTKQVDYTCAFLHAPIDRDPDWDQLTAAEQAKRGVFVDMPRGFSEPGKVLRLKKSLYGLKQSPRNFFQHLKTNLEQAGFVSTEIDPCLFVSDRVICLVYVDDTLLYSPKPEYIEEALAKLRNQGMDLEVEDSVAGFLGVHIDHTKTTATIKLTQKGLTQRIIKALNVGSLESKETPAEFGALPADLDGDPPQGRYSYASVIGMLQYLQAHSRPDITFAVSQCARYSHNTRRSHELALERIGQYLKLTQGEGLILSPSDTLDVDCYVDADFAGLWSYEDPNDPSCAKSRTGFVVCISNCPVIWQSKLQGLIALSTMEAEYNALSEAMKFVLPLRTLIRTVSIGVGLPPETFVKFRTTIWEDNNGALILAGLEPGRTTPRSKHYAVRIHWFRSHLKPNSIEVHKIDTKKQRADIFTKALRGDLFRAIRFQLCGW